MIGNIHLNRSVKGVWKKALLLAIVLFVFELLFVLTARSANIKADMIRDLDRMPPLMEKMLGQGFVDVIVKYGILTFGFVHPFTFIPFMLLMFLAISQMLTADITSGAIGFLLSRPLSRRRIFFNMAVVIWTGLALLSLALFLAPYLGILFFLEQHLTVAPFVNLSVNLYVVMLLISGYIAVFAAISDSGKKLFTYSGVMVLLFYLMELAAPLWRPLQWVAPVNPFHYYRPVELLMGQRIDAATAAILVLASAALYVIAAQLFHRRDISSG